MRGVARIAVAIAVLLTAVVVGFRWWRAHALDAALARFEAVTAPLVARGEPLGVFDRDAEDEPGREAAPDSARALVAALDRLHDAAGGSEQWPPGPWSLDDEELGDLDDAGRAALAAFVAAHAGFLGAVDAAASAPELSFEPLRAGDGGIGWEPTNRMLTLRDLLRARALFAEPEEERVAALQASLRIGRHWRTRTVVESLLAANLLERGSRDLCTLLAQRRIEPDEAATRLAPLLVPDIVTWYPAQLAAQRAWTLSMVDSVVDLPGVDDGASESLMAAQGFDAREFGRSLAGAEIVDAATDVVDLVERLIALPTNDHAALRAAASAATAGMREKDESWLPWARVRSLTGVGAASLAFELPEMLARVDTRLRLTRIALAAAARRSESGTWPPTLDELAPALGGSVPLDPSSGAPFDYVAAEDGGLRVSVPGDVQGAPDAIEWVAPR